MAARLPTDQIQQYKDSEEEKIAQEMLDVFLTDKSGFNFFNLVIRNTNAREGSSFTDASISLQVLDDVNLLRNDLVESYPKCGCVGIKDILQEAILRNFSRDGVDAVEKDPDYRPAFFALLEFLRGRNTHAKAIEKLFNSRGKKKPLVMTALAHHLFSQLVPGKEYEVDRYAKDIPKTCQCGCNANISAGNTSVGSQGTWHGKVDILLNHTIPVSVLQEQSVNEDDEIDSESTDENEGESEIKKRKIDKGNYDVKQGGSKQTEQKDKIDSCEIPVKVKSCKADEKVLYCTKVLKQIFAEAITNSFAQVHMNPNSLSNFLIPTFGATSEHITICLYDSENDYLLYNTQEIYLWTAQNKLNITAIMIIWLFLNFTVFTSKNLHSFVKLDKSGLHEELGQFLELYKKAETRGNYVSWTPYLHYSDVVPKFYSREKLT
ncbi:uncharacterized protein LOC117341091 [Pecten maximus]|uniref:uncharacterized protein LOC117341091 n=1 Tax=Pecten maximus TaxID=6579 RepID=UPI001457E9D6|nr:uncharacterized protein LOC117341091 [Pecten maximus]